jgi:hypothetical protein
MPMSYKELAELLRNHDGPLGEAIARLLEAKDKPEPHTCQYLAKSLIDGRANPDGGYPPIPKPLPPPPAAETHTALDELRKLVRLMHSNGAGKLWAWGAILDYCSARIAALEAKPPTSPAPIEKPTLMQRLFPKDEW